MLLIVIEFEIKMSNINNNNNDKNIEKLKRENSSLKKQIKFLKEKES